MDGIAVRSTPPRPPKSILVVEGDIRRVESSVVQLQSDRRGLDKTVQEAERAAAALQLDTQQTLLVAESARAKIEQVNREIAALAADFQVIDERGDGAFLLQLQEHIRALNDIRIRHETLFAKLAQAEDEQQRAAAEHAKRMEADRIALQREIAQMRDELNATRGTGTAVCAALPLYSCAYHVLLFVWLFVCLKAAGRTHTSARSACDVDASERNHCAEVQQQRQGARGVCACVCR